MINNTKMRYLIFIGFIAMAYFSCNLAGKKQVPEPLPQIKSCKIYSSDFAMFDPNDQGQLIQEYLFNSEGSVTDLIRYDVEGNEINRFDITGEQNPLPMPGKPEYVDTVLTIVGYDSLGNQLRKEVKIYNQSGLLEEVDFYEGDTVLLKKNTYEYDSLNMIWKDIYWDIELKQPRQVIIYKYEFFTD
ncbi:MAG: hypothetical protein A2W84_05280 [Bacteroidetes bacterium GWC2_40_13]|nr:MAG: hypothetical protein A2W84_05280 [Bacteroidetes bacterium GWC2_40_13]